MKNLNQPINITITSGTVVKTLFIILMLYFAFLIKDLLLIILTAVVIASSIEPGARWLMRRRIPRVLAVLLIYVFVFLILAGALYFFLPPLISDTIQFVNTIPGYVESISFGTEKVGFIPQLKDVLSTLSLPFNEFNLISSLSQGLSGATLGFLTTASTIFGGILSFILIIVLSFYLAVQENGVANFLRIIVPIQHEKYVLDLWRRSQQKIGLWMQGQLVLAILIGVLTYLGLSILGVPNPLLLAFIAALFELIPVFGPILASIPAIAFGFMSGGLSLGLMVIGLYVIIQQFESQLIHPLVVKKIVGIPALIAIVSLIIGAKIAGFLGILIAVPIAAIVMEYINDVEKKKLAQIKEMSE